MTEPLFNHEGQFYGYGAMDGAIQEKDRVLRAGAGRVNSINKTIKNIQSVQKYLQLNTVEVKSSIHSTISRLLEALRSREVWLLNQVDLVCQSKEEVLRKQEDRLNLALGGLNNCIDLVETGSATEEELMDYLESTHALEQHAEVTPHISFRSDMHVLRESIQNFGRVDSKGLSLLGGPFSLRGAEQGGAVGASSLPREFEEYGDEEHQILYKTVGDRTVSQEGNIVMNIPRLADLNRSSGVLHSALAAGSAAPTVTDNTAMKGLKSAGVLEGLLQDQGHHQCSRSASLRQWLSDITQGCGLDDDDDDRGMPVSQSRLTDLVGGAMLAPTSSVSLSAFDVKDVSNGKISSKIKIRISAPDEEEEQNGVLSHEGMVPTGDMKETKVKEKLFESFRRIVQQPLSDWLSRAYAAVIDSQHDQSQAPTGLTQMLSAFHRVINSPITEWLHAPHSIGKNNTGSTTPNAVLPAKYGGPNWSRPSSQMVACQELSGNTVLVACGNGIQLNDVEKLNAEIGKRKKDNVSDSLVGGKKDINVFGRLSGEENSWLIRNEDTSVYCPISNYVTNLSQQSIGQWLDSNRAVSEWDLRSSAESCVLGYCNVTGFPEPHNPLAAYIQRSSGMPTSHWLSSSRHEPMKEQPLMFNEGRWSSVGLESKEKYEEKPKSDYMEISEGYDIGANVARCPTSRWIVQTNNSMEAVEFNIGAKLSSIPYSDWLKITSDRVSLENYKGNPGESSCCNESSGNNVCWLAKERYITNTEWLAKETSVNELSKELKLSLPNLSNSMLYRKEQDEIKEAVDKEPTRMMCNLSYLRASLNADEVGDIEPRDMDDSSSMHSSFVEINRTSLEEPVSAGFLDPDSPNIVLPAAFSRPLKYWSQQGENVRSPVEMLQSDVGKSLLDKFDLMQVSDWLER